MRSSCCKKARPRDFNSSSLVVGAVVDVVRPKMVSSSESEESEESEEEVEEESELEEEEDVVCFVEGVGRGLFLFLVVVLVVLVLAFALVRLDGAAAALPKKFKWEGIFVAF